MPDFFNALLINFNIFSAFNLALIAGCFIFLKQKTNFNSHRGNLPDQFFTKKTSLMKTLALLSALFVSGTLFAQDYHEHVLIVEQSRRYLTYGDLTFTNNYQGLSLFMESLQMEGSPMYQKMAPRYADLQNRRTTAIVVAAGGSLVGTALCVNWFTRVSNDDTRVNTTPGIGGYPQANTTPSIGSFVAGLGLLTGSLIVARLTYNAERENLGFINAFNSQTEGVKLRLTGGMQPGLGGAYGGLGLQYRF